MNLNKFNYKVLLICLLLGGLYSCKNNSGEKETAAVENSEIADPWDEADEIIKNIIVPTFPDTTFNVQDYGAVADGTTNNSQAFADAIAACSEDGGGKVIVPSGKYLSGPIHLKSNVNFHLEDGAEILFSTNTSDYLPVVHTSYEGMEMMDYSPLIYAYQQENIAVTGKGTFNGQAGNDNWWPWSGAERYGFKEGDQNQRDEHNLPRLSKMVEDGVAVEDRVFGEGHQFRPTFFEPFECSNVLIKDVKFINAPFWVMHPIKSNNVTVDGVTVESHGPNNDGCNPEYSKNVHIKNCLFDTGDDCIAIKSGRDNDGRRVGIKSENIIVEDCIMKDGHGGVVMGSEISGGVSNVFVRNCEMNSPNLDRAIRIKTNTRRGGTIENIYVKNIEVGQVKEAVLKINTHYAIYDNQEGEFMPVIRNIYLEDINVENGGEYGILIRGREESPVANVNLTNVHIKNAETPLLVENAEKISFENVTINGKEITN
ncbi:glycoside hydrolase family 28 protein [Autumnicola psychrophila]|uniref:Glycoside hydrolase family 28 protein n=1 Tax=Autumnicola psychrophila TaxID=3075592 RepID=A0ABU3DTD9_9FLAO|nr:glycoside hydrolase family 28 protein [Zunongwangia sp. F225]MDT0686979.1 glycoside hydrolase family 28 protein [Zunongwangia sp. F225]